MQLAFRERLRREFDTRKAKNPRYSLRAFAASLGTDHAVISQIFKGTRAVPIRQIRSWATKIGMDREEASAYVTAAHVPDASVMEREDQLHQWSAEALSVVADPTHWKILRLVRDPAFKNDSRWIAQQIGVSVDQVNIALSRLLRLRLLELATTGVWRDLTGLATLAEPAFRKLALSRVRKMAAQLDVPLPKRKV